MEGMVFWSTKFTKDTKGDLRGKMEWVQKVVGKFV